MPHGVPNRLTVHTVFYLGLILIISVYLECDSQIANHYYVQAVLEYAKVLLITHRYNLSAFVVKCDDIALISRLNVQFLPPHNQIRFLEHVLVDLAQDGLPRYLFQA